MLLRLLFLLLLLGAPALGGTDEPFGVGGAEAGRAGGGIAIEHGAFSSSLQPAAVAIGGKDQFGFALQLGYVGLAGLPGVTLEEERWTRLPRKTRVPGHVALGGRRKVLGPLSLGWVFAVPWQGFYLYEPKDPWVPFAPRWSNQGAALNATVALGVELAKGLWIGGGLEVRPTASIDLDMRLGGDRDEEDKPFSWLTIQDLAVHIKPSFRPTAGLILDGGLLGPALQGARLGITWVEPQQIRLENVHINLRAADIGQLDPLFALAEAVQATANLALIDFYTPRRVTLGLGYAGRRLSAYLDLRYNQWSASPGPMNRLVEGEGDSGFYVDITDGTGATIHEQFPFVAGRGLPEGLFHDTVTVRAGMELRGRPRAQAGPISVLLPSLRFGLMLDPSYLGDDPGPNVLLDGQHLMVALGGSLAAFVRGVGPVELSLGLSYLRVFPRTFTQDRAAWPTGLASPVRYDPDLYPDPAFDLEWKGGNAVAGTLGLVLHI